MDAVHLTNTKNLKTSAVEEIRCNSVPPILNPILDQIVIRLGGTEFPFPRAAALQRRSELYITSTLRGPR